MERDLISSIYADLKPKQREEDDLFDQFALRNERIKRSREPAPDIPRKPRRDDD